MFTEMNACQLNCDDIVIQIDVDAFVLLFHPDCLSVCISFRCFRILTYSILSIVELESSSESMDIALNLALYLSEYFMKTVTSIQCKI